MKFSLVILWRHEGESCFSFTSFKKAKEHMHLLEVESGHKIVKMEIIQHK